MANLEGAPCAQVIPRRFHLFNVYNGFGAATRNELRFQFRLVSRMFRALPGFMGKSRVITVKSSTKRNNNTRSCT